MKTIVAISTAPGIGGIGIIRMSGKEAFSILNKIFRPKIEEPIEKIEGYTIKHGIIKDLKTDMVIDEVLVSYFKSPKSYTTEDMCEINSHGGFVVMKKILDLCLEEGADLAKPGEFTQRAFLNGRIDLSQAEAVIDIIHAKTEKEAISATNQLEGALSRKIKEIKQNMISVMADIEASIDYPEYDIEEVTNNKIITLLNQSEEELENLQNSFKNGKILREGIKTAIIGKPNVGKSSLLNVLLGEERAIVTEYEGTTRDTIEEYISVEGIPLRIIDTAGIRKADDEVEKIGINKSIKIAKDADLVISIFDVAQELEEQDREILTLIKDKQAILVLNKTDKGIIEETRRELEKYQKPLIEISALKQKGVDKIYKEITSLFELDKINAGEDITINLRHKDLIRKAIESIQKARSTLEIKMPIDIIAIDIKNILESLGEITGDSISEDIIKEVFSKFCLGK